jgi:Domain of unknown function (DUF4124)
MRLSPLLHALLALLSCAFLWTVPTPSHAEIFKCVSHEGKISYGDSPCAKGVAQSVNISAEVGACTTSECEAQHAQQATAAQLRLREEKQTLSEMTQQRRQAEAEHAAERIRLAEAQLAAEEQIAYQTDQTYYPAYGGYGGYPLYPNTLPCKRGNCVGRHPRFGMNGHIPARPAHPVRPPLLDPSAAFLTNPPAPSRSHR